MMAKGVWEFGVQGVWPIAPLVLATESQSCPNVTARPQLRSFKDLLFRQVSLQASQVQEKNASSPVRKPAQKISNIISNHPSSLPFQEQTVDVHFIRCLSCPSGLSPRLSLRPLDFSGLDAGNHWWFLFILQITPFKAQANNKKTHIIQQIFVIYATTSKPRTFFFQRRPYQVPAFNISPPRKVLCMVVSGGFLFFWGVSWVGFCGGLTPRVSDTSRQHPGYQPRVQTQPMGQSQGYVLGSSETWWSQHHPGNRRSLAFFSPNLLWPYDFWPL